MVSLLKAYWGDAATKNNEFAYHYLPKLDEKTIYTHIGLFERMYEGGMKGLFCFGQNPAVGGPNALKERKAVDPPGMAKECNGYAMGDYTSGPGKSIKRGEQIPSFAHLADDGSTCSGNWLYCGSYTEAGNKAARRNAMDAPNNIGLYPEWAWCWPVNRRIIYNRASVDLTGKPWDQDQWVIRWNESEKKWEGDVPDGGWAPGTKYAFIMKPHGHAQLFGNGLADGPFPSHYEAVESPVRNALYRQQNNPSIKTWVSDMNDIGTPDKFPIVCTTYRVVEHWQAGQMTRNLTWVSELMPDMFIELSEELAREKGIGNGDRVRITTARGGISAFAVVTPRFQPFKVSGKTVHQIGLPWHWGYSGLAVGESANALTPHVGDANTMIPEYKAFLEIEKSRKCTGCFDRVANDMLPACAKTCPTKSIRYGEKTALYERAQERVKQLKKEGHKNANVHGLDQLGGLHSIYVLLEKPDFNGLPENPTYGNLEPIQRKAQEKYAAWQRDHGKHNLASAGAGGALSLALASVPRCRSTPTWTSPSALLRSNRLQRTRHGRRVITPRLGFEIGFELGGGLR